MKIKADKSAWAEEFQRTSILIDPQFDYYTDYEYSCRVCKTDHVWTALQQKNHYEVLKRTGAVSDMCDACFRRYNILKNKFRKFHRTWVSESESSKYRAPYIEEWLTAIQEYKKYTDKYDRAMEHKLTNLVERNGLTK